MFFRDKELGRTKGKDRESVLANAKLQREARLLQKQKDAHTSTVQKFCFGRLIARKKRALERADWDSKIADIQKLKVVLQRPNMPLPPDILHKLLWKLLFFYNGDAADIQRLDMFTEIFLDSIKASANAMLPDDGQRIWRLRRLLELSLQVEPTETNSQSYALVRQMVKMSPLLLEFLCSDSLYYIPQPSLLKRYSDAEKISFPGLARKYLQQDERRKQTPSPLGQQMIGLLIELLKTNYRLLSGFVQQVLTFPLLPSRVGVSLEQLVVSIDVILWEKMISCQHFTTYSWPQSPIVGIPTVTWLLGNVLWFSDRIEKKSERTILLEVGLLSQLIAHIPQETYASDSIVMSWTNVTTSHAVPIVYPSELMDQLQILMKDRYIRKICFEVISFNPSQLRHPLRHEKVVPMLPTAPTEAEQFGFGDIASGSLSPWKKLLDSKSSWAQRLLGKVSIRWKNSKQDDDLQAFSGLKNTSDLARAVASGSMQSGSNHKQQLSGRPIEGKPFVIENVSAFASLVVLFMFRWRISRQSQSIKWLNCIAFLNVTIEESNQSSKESCVHFVTFLWTFLQEVKDFEKFSKSVDLVRAQQSDPYICVFVLFCMCYNHLLLVLDEVEMYEKEFPLPMYEIERIVVGLKRALFAAYWIHGNLEPSNGSPENLEFGIFVVDTAAKLMRDLYSRCSRRPFCNVTSWIMPDLDFDGNVIVEEVIMGTPRANKLICTMPFLVSFTNRVKLFQRLIQQDKQAHQSDGNIGFRIKIRRGNILEDGLSKLNVIRTNLKKKIHVTFINAAGREEVGIDAGGLSKEFWLDLSNLAFDLQYGLFKMTSDEYLYPNPNAGSAHFIRETDHLTLFQFVGRILGKVLYEGIVVQPKFAHFFLAKLLHSYNHINDLPSLDVEIYKNLMFLKSYDGDVANLGLTHTIVQDVFGSQKEIEIIPNGANIPVTNKNKTRYIHLVANYYLNVQIKDQSDAFLAGLSDLIDIRWLQMFNELELQVLISGKSGKVDIDDLKANTKYIGGYYAMDKRVIWFWQALKSFTPSEQAAFLRFTTSCQRAPSLGFASLTPPFCIQKIPVKNDQELLPAASTCFNTLKLPTYSSYKVLREKLLISISSGAGFEMT